MLNMLNAYQVSFVLKPLEISHNIGSLTKLQIYAKNKRNLYYYHFHYYGYEYGLLSKN